MEFHDIDALIESIKEQNVERNYWMVRTMGGAFYGDFIRNGYIAIGYNEISLQDISALEQQSHNAAHEELKALIANRRPDVANTGHPSGQLLRFVRDIKPDDVVMIPSTGSFHVAIGIVRSDPYEERVVIVNDSTRCPFYKRRSVDWKIYTRRAALPPMLQLMFASRHIVSTVNDYSPYIDSLLNDFYYKDETMHLVLEIKTRREVMLEDFCDLKALGILVDYFCREYGFAEGEPIAMKVQMESPGWLRLSNKNVKKMLVFGAFVVFLTGGGVKIHTENWNFDMSTNGVLQSISEFCDRQQDRGLVEAAARAVDSLKIKAPEDLQPIIDILNAKNEGREKY